MTPKPVNFPVLKLCAVLTTSITTVLAVCHYISRTGTLENLADVLPYLAGTLGITALAAPIVFATVFHENDHSRLRTIGWSWAAGITAPIAVWTLYGIILINIG